MELTNDFRVSAPPPRTWAVLTDVERIAPMLPGAQLQEIEGDDYRGIVKVKVGPITAQYKGTASFAERSEADGRMVLKATGRDTRGQGNASATITATMVPDGDGTKVTVLTDLTVTGKVAQFGRGVLADVSAKLIGQFVDALEADLQTDDQTPAAGMDVPSAAEAPTAEAPTTGAPTTGAPTTPVAEVEAVIPDNAPGAEVGVASGAAAGLPAGEPRIRRIDSPEPQPVDLLDAAGGSMAKRLVPLLAALGALILVLLIGRSRRNG